MANRKISDLTALTAPATGDLLPIVDISEAAAADKNKKITYGELLASAPDGSAAAPSFSFDSDPNTGIFNSSADNLAFSTGGTGRLFVDASGNIGVSAAPGSTGFDLGYLSGNDFYLFNRKNGAAVFGTNNAEYMRLTAAGLVGIGSSSPAARLHVTDLTASAVELMRLQVNLSSPSGNKSITWADAADVVGRISLDYTAPTAKMRFGSLYNSGYQTSDLMTLTPTGLGIGTTPSYLLHVSGGSDVPRIVIESSSGNSGFSYRRAGALKWTNYVDGTDNYVFYSDASGAERGRFDSSGRLLVGTSTARSNFFNTSTVAPALQIEGITDSTAALSLVHSSSSTIGGPLLILGKQKSGGVGGNTIVTDGNQLGVISFQGCDGSELVAGASIEAWTDSTTGANDMPGRLVFSTTADGASSPTERMRIKSAGTINFSNVSTYADNAAALAGGLVAGDVYRKSDGTLMITY